MKKNRVIEIIIIIILFVAFFNYFKVEYSRKIDSKARQTYDAISIRISTFHKQMNRYPQARELNDILFSDREVTLKDGSKILLRLEQEDLDRIKRYNDGLITVKCGTAKNIVTNKVYQEIDILYNDINGKISFREGFLSSEGKKWGTYQ